MCVHMVLYLPFEVFAHWTVNTAAELQAGKAPHADISVTEAERCTRRSEHLLYLQRRQRALLAAFDAEHDRLARLAKLLREVASGGGALPRQVRGTRTLCSQTSQADRVHLLVSPAHKVQLAILVAEDCS